MRPVERRASNASWKVTPTLITTAALVMGGCGGDTGTDTELLAGDEARAGPVHRYGLEVPVAYYELSFKLSKRTGGITPPVQARIFAYTGLALYESVVGGMPRHRSVTPYLNGIGELPKPHGNYHWPLVASAAMAEVMRGLWGDATDVAAQNIADIDELEARFESAADATELRWGDPPTVSTTTGLAQNPVLFFFGPGPIS